MAERKGFPKFKLFQDFLLANNRLRAKGQVIEDLFPEIIDWFANTNL